MTTVTLPIESERNAPSNVIPLHSARNRLQAAGARASRSSDIRAHAVEANAIEHEPADERLARRVERVLCALLYHSAFEPTDLRKLAFHAVEKRVRQLVSRDRLTAVSRAAISLELTSDLTRLAAAAITFELKTQSQWRNRVLRVFSAQRRQINADVMAIANLLAWDMDALKIRPIDEFAKFI